MTERMTIEQWRASRRAADPARTTNPEGAAPVSATSAPVTLPAENAKVPYLPPDITDPDPALEQLVPEHLLDDYRAAVVPRHVVEAAVRGGAIVFPMRDQDPAEAANGDLQTYKQLVKETESRALTVAEAVHEHRLAAARQAQRVRDTGALYASHNPLVACPVCGEQTRYNTLHKATLDPNTGLPRTSAQAMCRDCRTAAPKVWAELLAKQVVPRGGTRRDLLTAALAPLAAQEAPADVPSSQP